MLSWRIAVLAGLVAWTAGCRADPVEPSSPLPRGETVQKPPLLIAPITGGSDLLRQQVIRFFAPVIYQDIEDHSEADLFSRITFDGDWSGVNNWANTFRYPKRAYVYTSLIEDANRYFLHYGLYWPRDWCGGTCTGGQDFHENDMEGLSLVVDKRLIASGWPFGQVVTMDTRSHNGVDRYRNCSLTGYAPYVGIRSGGAPPCFILKSGFNSTSPSPPARVAAYANSQSHATRAFRESDFPFAGGDGVVYFPTDQVAEVPASTFTTTETAYTVQWMDSTEVQNYSLWSERRNPIMASPTSIFEYDYAGTVGPHDVYYLKFFACGQPYCPSLFPTRAKAPWGIQASSAERLGEWHNHPAWSWSRTYAPLNGSSPYYEYTCQSETCRKSNTYIHNIYWNDAAWTTGGVSGGGGPSCRGCPKTTADAPVAMHRPHGAERRWDFDAMDGIDIAGDARATMVTLPDEEWGYGGGQVRALRVEGRGETRITLRGELATDQYSQLIVRVKRARGRPATLGAEWSPRGARTSPARAWTLVRDQAASKSWEIVTLPLADIPGWTQAGKVDRLTLTVRLDGGPGDAVDLDFVVVAP